jgi:phage terminase small subunit
MIPGYARVGVKDMSGPPPIPTKLKLLRGNPGHKRLNLVEPEPPVLPACPEPPAFITGYAAEEWRRAAPDLHVTGCCLAST